MRPVTILGILCIFASSVFASDIDREVPYEADTPADRVRVTEIRRSMNSVVYESLDLSQLPFGAAVQLIQDSIPKSNRAYSYVLKLPTDPEHAARLNEPSGLSFTNATLPMILNEVCDRYNLLWSCEGKIFIGAKIE